MPDTRRVNECAYRACRIDSFGVAGIIEHTMNKSAKLAELRHSLARYGLPADRPAVPLGNAAVDGVLGGGLRPGALHEVFARGWSGSGFAVLLALLAAGTKTLFW